MTDLHESMIALVHGENGSERENIFWRVIYASETNQNCKNPTGHIDTLRDFVNLFTTNKHNKYQQRSTFVQN